MTTSNSQPTGPGNPSEALSAALDVVVSAVKNPPVEPAPDPRVTAAFALGWQMAELYRPDAPTRQPAASHDDLPTLRRLGDQERTHIAFQQISAAVAKLADTIKAANLDMPNLTTVGDALKNPVNRSARATAVKALHVELLATLTAADFRLGKAYGLGRSLADTCRNPVSGATVQAEFKPIRIAKLLGTLDDLASSLPAHAGHAVGNSLGQWSAYLSAGKTAQQREAAADAALHGLVRQGQLWRALLSGEKAGQDMLAIKNYVVAANNLFKTTRKIVLTFLGHFWYVGILALALLVGGVWLIVEESSSASTIAGIGGILASLGVTWRSLGTAVGGLGPKLGEHLWGAELDQAIANAITMLPESKTMLPKKKRDYAKRLDIATNIPHKASEAALPAPQLLNPILDPDQLLQRVTDLQRQAQTNAKDIASIPRGQCLPPGHLDQLATEIEAEKNDPARVTRASSPPAPDGPPAPPPVIYMSRRPTVSQFMSVITDCFEADINRPALQRVLHLSAIDRVWQDVERWTEDLRSRFREFGPCDIRFLEPKLAEVLTGLLGNKHPFVTSPPGVKLAEKAKVIILGDWATALPQAINVAARIRERLQQGAPEFEYHVIHLGDTYYSGLEDECRRRFLDQWPVAPQSAVKSWTLAGNHDMYSGGHGYYDVLLADPRFAAQGRCSYFALANDHWQLLGLDSSYKNPDEAGLQDPQRAWLSGRINTAGQRRTILLTHHQPFSAYEQVNPKLENEVAEAIGAERTVEAWLWGHEHRCAVYNPGVFSVRPDVANYAAVIGHGGVPQLLPEAGAPNVNKDMIKWAFTDYYQVGDDHWSLGGFAVLTFIGQKLEIQYFDEYGQPRHEDPPVGFPSEAAGLQDVIKANQSRALCQPDTLPATA
jgi:hypothetical protein